MRGGCQIGIAQAEDAGVQAEVAPVEIGIVQLRQCPEIAPGAGTRDAGKLGDLCQGEARTAGIEGLDDREALLEARNKVAIAWGHLVHIHIRHGSS